MMHKIVCELIIQTRSDWRYLKMKGEKPTESTDEISAKDPLKVESVTE